MYYRYIPYPYYRRYYSIDPYHYGRYYYPFYNVVDSQVADVNQSITNYGDMTDVIQDSNIYQSMTPEPTTEPIVLTPESVENTEVTIEHTNIISVQ